MGFWVKVYPNRIEYKTPAGVKSIPIMQVASIEQAMAGVLKITIETTGGQQIVIPTSKKKELTNAIYDAQAKLSSS